MVSSLDSAVSSLLCEEEGSLVFDDGVDSGILEEFRGRLHRENLRTNKRSLSFYDEEILNNLPTQSEECLTLMIKRECEHLPGNDYLERLKNGDLDLNARQQVIEWIHKVHWHFNFSPLCLYLTISYLDRFLSSYKLPTKAWMMQLLGVACLSLASKVEETELPFCQDLQVMESKFIFEARTIQRMELLVLSTLGWRMQAVTPFSFVHYFLKKICGEQMTETLSTATELILRMIEEINFLEFRPSEIAVAVALCAARETQAAAVYTDETISALVQDIQMDRVLKCVEWIHELVSVRRIDIQIPDSLIPSVAQSPVGVLDVGCFCCKTDDTAGGSCTNSSHSSQEEENCGPDGLESLILTGIQPV